jgi:LysR family glycine cleavage system transcriptional activator
MAPRRIPSLNWLRVFEAAARTGSFVSAGHALNISPPAVSKQIRALEGYLRQPLFLRGAHHVTLTQAGRAFVPIVREALLSIESTTNSMFGESTVTPLNLYLPYILGCSWFAGALGSFEESHPHIRLQLLGDVPAPGMLAPSHDMQITYGSSPGSWGDNDRLFGETLYPVALPHIARTVKTPRDLTRHRLIEIGLHRSGWIRFIADEVLEELQHIEFRYTDSTPIALAMAASGLGIALARAPATDFLVRQLGLVRCLDGAELTTQQAYFLLYPSRKNLHSAASEFRTWLLDRVQAEAAGTS